MTDQWLGEIRQRLELEKAMGGNELLLSEQKYTIELPAPEAPRPAQPAAPAAPPTARSTEREQRMEKLKAGCLTCTKCPLAQGRTKVVFGQGATDAELLFVGEGPGADEDRTGIAFIGRAGQLLTKIIEAMGFSRDDVFIANIIKCRPPQNRTPNKTEIDNCLPYLLEQISIIRPKVICALGSPAARTLLGTDRSISRIRGQWFDFYGAKLMPTFHPAYLLRTPADKKKVWEDMQKVMQYLKESR